MATISRVSPEGWTQYDDGTTISRVTPTGFIQFESAAAAPTNKVFSKMYQGQI